MCVCVWGGGGGGLLGEIREKGGGFTVSAKENTTQPYQVS